MDITNTIIYIILFATFLVVELKAVFDKKRGDTFSENVWWLQKHIKGLRYVVAAALVWLVVHFFLYGSVV